MHHLKGQLIGMQPLVRRFLQLEQLVDMEIRDIHGARRSRLACGSGRIGRHSITSMVVYHLPSSLMARAERPIMKSAYPAPLSRPRHALRHPAASSAADLL